MHANWILPRAVTFAVDAVIRWMVPPGGNVCVLQLAREGLRKKLANTTQILKGCLWVWCQRMSGNAKQVVMLHSFTIIALDPNN